MYLRRKHHVLSQHHGSVDLALSTIHAFFILFFLQNYMWCSEVIYLEVNIQAMCLDEAEVNPMASHTGQLAGC